jgi:stage III sporulation protein AA
MFETEDKYLKEILERDIYPVLSDFIAAILKKIPFEDIKNLEEIRIRAEKPLMILKRGQDYFINSNSANSTNSISTTYLKKCEIIHEEELRRTLQLMSNYSIYAIEEELKQGFMTLRGGHRVGFTGRGVIEENKIKILKNISSLNIRIAREVIGCGNGIVSKLYSEGVKHTLIVSPPGCGKTTMLRDVIRILSNGSIELKLRGYKICVVDERSEIAGCYLGIPQRNVGIRTDVLDACPKAQGMIMLLRSMSPEIIAVDEIGSYEDSKAIEDAMNSGIKVIATAHGDSIEEIVRKSNIRNLIQDKLFDKIVILSRRNGPGTVEDIIENTEKR